MSEINDTKNENNTLDPALTVNHEFNNFKERFASQAEKYHNLSQVDAIFNNSLTHTAMKEEFDNIKDIEALFDKISMDQLACPLISPLPTLDNTEMTAAPMPDYQPKSSLETNINLIQENNFILENGDLIPNLLPDEDKSELSNNDIRTLNQYIQEGYQLSDIAKISIEDMNMDFDGMICQDNYDHEDNIDVKDELYNSVFLNTPKMDHSPESPAIQKDWNDSESINHQEDQEVEIDVMDTDDSHLTDQDQENQTTNEASPSTISLVKEEGPSYDTVNTVRVSNTSTTNQANGVDNLLEPSSPTKDDDFSYDDNDSSNENSSDDDSSKPKNPENHYFWFVDPEKSSTTPEQIGDILCKCLALIADASIPSVVPKIPKIRKTIPCPFCKICKKKEIPYSTNDPMSMVKHFVFNHLCFQDNGNKHENVYCNRCSKAVNRGQWRRHIYGSFQPKRTGRNQWQNKAEEDIWDDIDESIFQKINITTPNHNKNVSQTNIGTNWNNDRYCNHGGQSFDKEHQGQIHNTSNWNTNTRGISNTRGNHYSQNRGGHNGGYNSNYSDPTRSNTYIANNRGRGFSGNSRGSINTTKFQFQHRLQYDQICERHQCKAPGQFVHDKNNCPYNARLYQPHNQNFQ